MYQSRSLVGSADALAAHLDSAIASGSVSASLENSDALSIGDARLVVRTYERFSMAGSNRVSLSVSILEVGDQLKVALSTAGGSQAVFFKINTFGEEAFMQKGLEALDAFTG